MQPPVQLRPDTLLYIYYIEGVIPAHQAFAAGHYLGNWVEEDFSFLFFNQPAEKEVEEILALFPNAKLLDRYEMTYGHWQGGNITPLRIGRFLLNPPWIKASPGKDDVSITVDAGLVFGNGAHPTTQACLEAIDIACAGRKVATMLRSGHRHRACWPSPPPNSAVKRSSPSITTISRPEPHGATRPQPARRPHPGGQRPGGRNIPPSPPFLVANIHYEVMKELVRTEGFLGRSGSSCPACCAARR